MTIYLHEGDLPRDVFAPGPIAVDSETMGLNPHRDRLCLVQLADGHGDEHLVRFSKGHYDAPVRTYTDRHGLKDVLRETIGVDISKAQQSSDWGAAELSEAQKDYAASDVRFLHRAHAVLAERLAREGRTAMAQACFDFLPTRAALDLAGWPETDIFAHM